jgi:hypothetical protein
MDHVCEGRHSDANRVIAITLMRAPSALLSKFRKSEEFFMNWANAHRGFGLAAIAALAACSTTTPNVVAVEDNAYRVRVVGAPYESQADTNLRALNAAHAYCGTLAKHVMFRQSVESSDGSWSKQEDLTFVCMDAKDPAYMRASVEREPAIAASQQ